MLTPLHALEFFFFFLPFQQYLFSHCQLFLPRHYVPDTVLGAVGTASKWRDSCSQISVTQFHREQPKAM